jgi:hypothetical protein
VIQDHRYYGDPAQEIYLPQSSLHERILYQQSAVGFTPTGLFVR